MQIIITGTVGVGKSTISSEIKRKIKSLKKDVVLYREIIEKTNPYLKLYYQNRSSWSFLIQMDYLFKRFKEAFEANKKDKKDSITIFDRHFLDDFIFANMKIVKKDMSKTQWNSYEYTNLFLSKKIKTKVLPDYLILLKADFDVIVSRVKKRGREEEKKVDLNYWKQLYHSYYIDKKIESYLRKNVKKMIVIDTNKKTTKEITNEILKVTKLI